MRRTVLSYLYFFTGNREWLEVEINAYPKPLIEWFLNGKLVVENRTLRTYFDGRLAVLKIYEAHPEHQGQFLCRVSNQAGTAETRCNVVVEGALLNFHCFIAGSILPLSSLDMTLQMSFLHHGKVTSEFLRDEKATNEFAQDVSTVNEDVSAANEFLGLTATLPFQVISMF